MGALVVPVRELLSKPQLVLDQWMPLDGALPESEILLRAELKVGEEKKIREWMSFPLVHRITDGECNVDRS